MQRRRGAANPLLRAQGAAAIVNCAGCSRGGPTGHAYAPAAAVWQTSRAGDAVGAEGTKHGDHVAEQNAADLYEPPGQVHGRAVAVHRRNRVPRECGAVLYAVQVDKRG